MTARQAYDWLLRHSREVAYIASTAELLYWDQRTQIPRQGQNHRAEQLAALTRIMHERNVDPRIGEMLALAEGMNDIADPTSDEAVNTRQWRRHYERTCRIPESLATEITRAASRAEAAWEEYRPTGDWDSFRPHLENLFNLKREEAEAVGYESEAYDALLDEYEPGERAATIEPVFARLREATVELLEKVRASRKSPDMTLIERPTPRQAQERFLRAVVEKIGLDFESSRIDTTSHPFSTTIGPGDSRITTRYRDDDWSEAFFSAVHECGHTFYGLGLPPEHWGTPCGADESLGLHESQSRFWENFVARTPGFWEYFLPEARAHFPWLADSTPEDITFAVSIVRPSFIRTEADEVTYNLHVMLRFELELALFRGELAIADLPEAWNAKSEEFLGIRPPDHGRGVMQDIHWSGGAFGYFPTYTLGNLYAAQFRNAAEKDLGNLEDLYRQGDFKPVLDWQRKHIHSQGMRFTSRELVRRVTGEYPDSQYLIDYLTAKVDRLYGD